MVVDAEPMSLLMEDMTMRTYDFSPLFRTTVGFDRMARMIDALASEQNNGYPPYNIEKLDEDSYQISMAVAGFSEDDLTIEVKENVLTISGRKEVDEKVEEERSYLYRGIAERAFERRFNLADHIKVEGAIMEHGLLHVKLSREVPEELKPRRIPIGGRKAKKLAAK